MAWRNPWYTPEENEEKKEKDPNRKGEGASPKFVDMLVNQKGFHWNEEREWWQRVWFTYEPGGLKEIWEVEKFDTHPFMARHPWIYKIVNPSLLDKTDGSNEVIWSDRHNKD